MNPMTADRVRALLAVYGADPARWPAGEREAALRLIEENPALSHEAADAARVDMLLDALPDPTPSPALRVALKGIPDRARLRWADRLATLWPFGAPWRPAAGLVAAALVGIVVGIATPEVGTADTAQPLAYDPIAEAAAMASGADSLETLP